MSLFEALSDLKETLKSASDTNAALISVARDYELNPQLVERKFRESTGLTMEAFVEAHKRNSESETQKLANKKSEFKVLVREHNQAKNFQARDRMSAKAFALADELGVNLRYRR